MMSQDSGPQMRPAGNPLTAWFDADPAGWLPFVYSEFVDIGIAANAQATMVFRTLFAPFMWTHVTHGIAGNVLDPETSGLYDDGQYLVSMNDEHRIFVQNPVPADLAFGPRSGHGSYQELPFPVFFPANNSVTITLTNIYARVLTPEADTFRVYFALRGMHYWGLLDPPDELLRHSQGQGRR